MTCKIFQDSSLSHLSKQLAAQCSSTSTSSSLATRGASGLTAGGLAFNIISSTVNYSTNLDSREERQRAPNDTSKFGALAESTVEDPKD
jgi:hypothetical protein